MLKRLLASLAILSLLIGAAVLVLWFRSYHHTDHFSLKWAGDPHTTLLFHSGRMAVTQQTEFAGTVSDQTRFYPIRQVAAGCLAIPALWLAVFIRGLLPRPGASRFPRPDKQLFT